MKRIYLDYAAATPVDPKVFTAMEPYFAEEFYNPSATYLAAKKVRTAVEDARSRVAQILGARSAEIIFTAGATEANNLALRSVMGAYPDKRIIVSAIEHESVLALAHRYNCSEAPVTLEGLLDLVQLAKLIGGDTVLVSVLYANNDVGTIQPLREITDLVRQERVRRRQAANTTPLYLHTDATQAANYVDLHVSRLGVDLMTLNGGKIYGPKQTGALYARTGVELQPLVYGGGQERALRSGTENVPGIIGFAVALQLAQEMRQDEARRLQELQHLFFDLLEAKIPQAVISGSRKKRLPNNVHVVIAGQDNERLLMALDEAGIMAAAGSACAASNEEPSHVLKAMGISDADAQSSVRFTMGRGTTEADIRQTVDVLAKIVS